MKQNKRLSMKPWTLRMLIQNLLLLIPKIHPKNLHQPKKSSAQIIWKLESNNVFWKSQIRSFFVLYLKNSLQLLPMILSVYWQPFHKKNIEMWLSKAISFNILSISTTTTGTGSRISNKWNWLFQIIRMKKKAKHW